MPSSSIVIDFDVLKNSNFRLISTGKDGLLHALLLQGCPKALDHCVIIAIAFFTHADLNSLLVKHHLIANARIFTSSIGMVNEASSWLSLKQCHGKCRLNKFCIMM